MLRDLNLRLTSAGKALTHLMWPLVLLIGDRQDHPAPGICQETLGPKQIPHETTSLHIALLSFGIHFGRQQNFMTRPLAPQLCSTYMEKAS